MVNRRLVQVPAAVSSSATDLPPNAIRPERQQPSNAWLDTTESIPVDSEQFDEPSTAASLQGGQARSRGLKPGLTVGKAALTISVAAAEQ